MNKFKIIICALLISLLGCSSYLVAADKNILDVGNQLPLFSLSAPPDLKQCTYLGLQANQTFSLEQIKGEIVIIEIFSMYCPHCQKDAPAINELYTLIQNDPSLARRIKLIGIGAGNSTFEVDIFKNKYQVEFPLFADDDLSIHEKLGSVRTPYFIGICTQGQKKNRIFFSQLAGFAGARNFLDEILKQADCR
ncbi:MAG: TlpA family protein disulfide reductase [Deltaproteobacteria bacterium]|nr:TlpA family protein disulfide reductase [Deltaproteobacteria bacterium]